MGRSPYTMPSPRIRSKASPTPSSEPNGGGGRRYRGPAAGAVTVTLATTDAEVIARAGQARLALLGHFAP